MYLAHFEVGRFLSLREDVDPTAVNGIHHVGPYIDADDAKTCDEPYWQPSAARFMRGRVAKISKELLFNSD
jgi:hypothetical protein